MLFCESRATARRGDAGDYVPLDDQDIARWDHDLREQAEQALRTAAALDRPGAYQLEAAIQSAHCARRLGAEVPPQALLALYDGLLALRPGLGAQVSRACALANAAGPTEGLRALDAFTPAQIANYQPYWAARAHLLGETGHVAEARKAFARAAGLSTSPAIRAYLMAASDRL